MRVNQLIKELEKLPQDKPILCQVIAQDEPSAWNMFYEFIDIEESSFVQLSVYHPNLKELPDVDS